MYTKSILVASLAVSAATATHIYPAHNRMRRDLQARQTDSGGDPSAVASAAQACLTDLASAYASMPTPPADLLEWEQTVVVSDPCHFTIPQSISSAVVEYESEVEDWYSSNSAAIASAISECPTYSSYGNYDGGDGYSSYGDFCSTAGGSGGSGDSTAGGSDATTTGGSKTTATNASGGSKTTATNNGGSGTTATNGATTAATPNAGPKETAVFGAALAVAGVLGVVAAL